MHKQQQRDLVVCCRTTYDLLACKVIISYRVSDCRDLPGIMLACFNSRLSTKYQILIMRVYGFHDFSGYHRQNNLGQMEDFLEYHVLDIYWAIVFSHKKKRSNT